MNYIWINYSDIIISIQWIIIKDNHELIVYIIVIIEILMNYVC